MLNFVGYVTRRESTPKTNSTRGRFVRALVGRRRDRRRHSDDRAGADAHLLGHDVLPLRVSRDFDRALRPQRERRLRVRDAPHVRHALDRQPFDSALAAVRGRHRAGARRAGSHPRGAELFAREPRQDDRDLHTGRASVFFGRRRHLSRDHPAQEAGQRRLRRRSHRGRHGMPAAAAAVESLRRARRRAAGRRARRRRSAALLAREGDREDRGHRGPCRRHSRRPAADGSAPFDVINTKGHDDDTVLFAKWNSFSRVAVYDRSHGDWSLSSLYKGEKPETRFMDIDSAASTPIVRFDGDLSKVEYPEIRAHRARLSHDEALCRIHHAGDRSRWR